MGREGVHARNSAHRVRTRTAIVHGTQVGFKVPAPEQIPFPLLLMLMLILLLTYWGLRLNQTLLLLVGSCEHVHITVPLCEGFGLSGGIELQFSFRPLIIKLFRRLRVLLGGLSGYRWLHGSNGPPLLRVVPRRDEMTALAACALASHS